MTILFLQSLWAKKKKGLTKKSRTERLCETTKSVGKQLGMQLVEIGFSSSFSLTNLNMLKVSIHEFLPQIHYVHILMYMYHDQFLTDFLNHCLEFQMSKRNCLEYD